MKTQLRILTLITVLLITVSAFAQPADRKLLSIEDRLNNVIEKIEKKIELADNQKEAVKSAFNDFFVKADEKMQEGKHPEKIEMEGLEKERDEKIKAVLTEDQYEDYLRIICQLRPHPNRKEQKPMKHN